MDSLNHYRKTVKSLESQKQKLEDDYNKASNLYSEGISKTTSELTSAHKSLDAIIVSEATKAFSRPSRARAMFEGLFERDERAAIDWAKTKFCISKGVNYSATVKRVKRDFGYALKEGERSGEGFYQDDLLKKHREFSKIIRDLYVTSVSKKPIGKSECLGVEIECFVPETIGDIRAVFQDYCTRNKITGVQAKSDSSIRPDRGFIGIEITILVRKDNLRSLEKVCEWLSANKARVNASCGLHVHLDFRNRTDIEKCGTRLYNALPYLSRLVPETRRSSTYCKLEKNSSTGSGDRYCAINLSAYQKYKTLEVRLHSGTCNFKKIMSWSLLISNIMDNEKFSKVHSDTSIDKFIELLNFKNDDLNYYIYERYKKFNGESPVIEEKGEE